MKNLLLANVNDYQIGSDRKVDKFTVDTKNGILYFYADGLLTQLVLQSRKETITVNLVEYYESQEKIPKLTSMDYLESSMAVCFIFINGDILFYSTVDNDLQCTGIVSTGVRAAAWSPDEEVIAIVTGEDNLIIMTCAFDPITEVPLHQQIKGEIQFINVGWGKKETQFHGSEGKAAAKIEHKTSQPVFDWDDCSPRISWRGDGELLVISMVNSHSRCRQLRIFNREGSLQCTSEDVDGLEPPVSWKPSGALIASVQRLPNKYMVVFFEKNGLRHGEFNLPFGPNEVLVKDLSWNADSTLLAVHCESMKGSENLSGYIQLWSVNNYHWYLKKVVRYATYGQISLFSWDTLSSYRLHFVCGGSIYANHDYCWTVNHSKGKTAYDSSCVAVIDGDKLLITPFQKVIVPPPMSSYTISMPLPINEVVFPSFASNRNYDPSHEGLKLQTNDFLLILADNSIVLFCEDEELVGEQQLDDNFMVKVSGMGSGDFKRTTKSHKPVCRFTLDWTEITKNLTMDAKRPEIYRHWQWVSEELLVCYVSDGSETCILTLSLPALSVGVKNDGSILRLVTASPLRTKGLVVSTAVSFREEVCNGDSSKQILPVAALQLENGQILRYEIPNDISAFKNLKGEKVESLPIMIKMEVCRISGVEFIFGLTSKHRFYINNNEVLSDCSSFFVHSEYLLLTTNHHTLISVLLEKSSIEMFIARKLEGCEAEDVRRVERGSRIVIARPKHSKVVLQMPRGNLECIEPRALSLHIIANFVERKEYGKAFDLARVQRINLNVLCDIYPNEFILDLKDFVSQVKNPTWLSLFLCELQPENVCETMYSNFYHLKMIRKKEKLESKLEVICDSLRKAMEAINEKEYLLPILTSYVMKKTKEGLVSALKRVQSIKVPSNENKGEMSRDEALKYLIYLVDVDALYDAALGIYDFDLVLMIAAKSSKDPKEYIPFINGLRKLEINYQHYKIDMHLKLYSSALKSIAKCADEHSDELMSLISSQNLYTEALKLFPKDGKLHQQICDAYADHLLRKKLYEEAGIMQKLSKNFEKALQSFKSAANWRQTLILAHELNYSQSQMSQLCCELAADLKDRRKFSDAAFILNEYLKDHEECVEALTCGCLWEEAIRVSLHCNRLDLIETHVVPGIKEHCETLVSRLNTNNELFVKYKNRLAIVQEEKVKKQLEVESKGEENFTEDDLASEASSVIGSAVGSSFHSSSKSSSHSRSSAKNRRKHERKLLSLKEGNPNEQSALINALNNLYVTTFSQETKDEVRGLCLVLIQYGYNESAGHLQNLLHSMQSEMLKARAHIWPSRSSEENLKYGPQATSNVISEFVTGAHALNMQSHDLTPTPPDIKTDSSWRLNILLS
ncbi:elongator complex protein 1 [Hetaerina americana]|uniref:elongator complex protein 1 n=1 Tax=Hetaerina americana TaxID=62018 RepID=UPI003A7F4223